MQFKQNPNANASDKQISCSEENYVPKREDLTGESESECECEGIKTPGSEKTPLHRGLNKSHINNGNTLPRKHAPNTHENSFGDQLNIAQNDAAADLSRPETPAVRLFIPRIKQRHEEDLEVGKCQDLLPTSDPNKRRRRTQILGEDGLEQRGAWEKLKSKFEFLDPSIIRDAKLRILGDPFYDKRSLHIPKDVLNKMPASQKRYWTTKSQYMDTILFFKVGKFYELYEVDAEVGQKEFDWKMTITGVGKCRQVGVPESGIEDSIQKLLERGYKVGRMEQLETTEPAKAKRGLTATVQRELVHISTPSTAIDENFKAESVNLLALKEDSREETEDEDISAKENLDLKKKVFVGESKEDESFSPVVPKTSVAARSKVLFMGNLPYSIGCHSVLKFFEDVGSVVDIRMAKNADGSKKGFCHVTFATEAAAVKALEKNGEMLYNRNVKLDLAENLRNKHVLDSTVLVRGLEKSQWEEDIRKSLFKHFEDCGGIKDVHVPMDIEAGDSRRVAFIKFEDSEAVSKAVELCGSELGDSKLFVKEVSRSRFRR